MRSIKNEVATELMAGFDPYSPPQPFPQILLTTAQKVAPDLSDMELADNLLEPRQKEQYRSYLAECQRLEFQEGKFCPYDILDSSDQIVGYCVPRQRDAPLMARRRQIAIIIPKVLEVLRAVTPNDFEHFGRNLLKLLKADETHVTRHSGDEGIDFFGWLNVPETLIIPNDLPTFRSDFRVFVIGQAKRYSESRPIGTPYIRELVGSTTLFRHDQLSPWQSRYQVPSIKLMTPILPLIITTGKVSSDARDLAKRAGVVTKDGAQLAEFLCLEGVGIYDNLDTGKAAFNKDHLLAWLAVS